MTTNKKPNILFLFSDQQRWDTLGCYGQPLPTTPNLDQMASDGALFQNCYTMQPVCGPARASLQTGMYASQHGAYTNGIPLNQNVPLLARELKDVGYELGYIGKWHLASKNGDNNQNYRTAAVPMALRGGYEDFWLASNALEHTSHSYDGHMFDQDNNRRDFPKDRYRVDVQTDWLIEYLDSRDGDKPFFCFCSYLEPHHQNDHQCYEGPHGSKEQFKDFVAPGDLAGHEGEGDWEKEYPDYLGCINSLDENLGRIRAALKANGQDENTLIIYTSDHGSHFCTRTWEYKRSPHESCTHVPLLICGPGIPAGTRIDEMVSLIDLPPSILQAAGAVIPPTFQGADLQPLINGEDVNWENEVFIEISESQVGRAIRTPDWCFAVHAPEKHACDDARSDTYVDAYLYDLKADPHEQNNLIGKAAYVDIRNQLAQRLAEKINAIGDGPVKITTAPIAAGGN
jgi:uncharacterized sulfatase